MVHTVFIIIITLLIQSVIIVAVAYFLFKIVMPIEVIEDRDIDGRVRRIYTRVTDDE